MNNAATEAVYPLLEEQIRFYDAWAPEYDDWWERRNRYDLGERLNRKWRDEIAGVHSAFAALPAGGELLEPAAGTGYWTEHFARRGCRVMAIEASPRMLEINRDRIARAGLTDSVVYENSDVFQWRTGRPYDGIFLGYWLSHVPASFMDDFLKRMYQSLCPGGFLLVLDSKPGSRYAPWHGTQTVDTELELRSLPNGQTFRVIKRHILPKELNSRLQRAGFSPQVECTPEFFIYAVAHRL